MSIINSQPLIGASGNQGVAGYNLTKSLRFRSAASAYCDRSVATSGNLRKWTISTWIKRGILSSADSYIFSQTNIDGSGADLQYSYLFFDATDHLVLANRWGSSPGDEKITTNAVFRDPSAWYHVVFVWDADNATQADRAIIYVNGVRQSVTGSYTQSKNSQWNSQTTAGYGQQQIGRVRFAGTWYYAKDFYLAETHSVDGQVLTPASFGETDTITGVWKPKAYTGTYGTNGFYLPFTDVATTSGSNAGLGKDFSGNGNYFNTNNISVTTGATYDSMTDVPTLTSATAANYCTINGAHVAVVTAGGTYSISNANLSAGAPGAAKWFATLGTFPMAIGSGKWYYEFRPTNSSTDKSYAVGIFNVDSQSLTNPTYDAQAAGYAYSDSGIKANNGSAVAYGATWANGDIIGVAIDATGATTSLTFYKNNTSQGVAYTGITGTVVPAFGAAGANGTFSVNFGQQPFTYTPPTGFKALNTFNLPDSTIVAGNKVMDATTFTGNGSNPVTVTNAAGFKPDLVWGKIRSQAYNNQFYDSVRGTGKSISSNSTGQTITNETDGYLTSFNTNGFTAGVGATSNNYWNQSSQTYVAWQWQAGQGSSASNTSGSITSTVSVNASAGFSIVQYVGTGANATVGHGLGVAPKMILVKSLTRTDNWIVYHSGMTSAAYYMYLNLTNAQAVGSTVWNSTAPTSTVFSLGNDTTANSSGATQIAYCWSEIAGFSKFGSYTGNGSADGTFVYTGFRPKFVLIKGSSFVSNWFIEDGVRNGYNVNDGVALRPNLSGAEDGTTTYNLDILSNGFKLRTSSADSNTSGATFIYAAFAENPLKHSLAR